MAVRLWTCAQDIPAEYRVDGGVWDAVNVTLVSGNQVQSVADSWGVRAMNQNTSGGQPFYGERSGLPAIVWPDTASNRRLQVESSFAPVYWVFVLAYNDGSRATFLNAPTIIMYDGSNRVIGRPNTNQLVDTVETTWARALRKNAGAYSAVILPMPQCMAELVGPKNSGRWCLGSTVSNNGWQGPMWFAMALGTEPTGDLLARIQGYLAWRFGLQGDLPAGHAYKNAAPTVDDGVNAAGRGVTASAGRGRTSMSLDGRGRGSSGSRGSGRSGMSASYRGGATTAQIGYGRANAVVSASGAAESGSLAGGLAFMSMVSLGGAITSSLASGMALNALVSSGGAVAGHIAYGRSRFSSGASRRWAYAGTSANALIGPSGLNYTRVPEDA